MYRIIIAPQAKDDLLRLQKSEPLAFKKAQRFIEELMVHPKTGTGHPEPLRKNLTEKWSREITKKHRMIYEIFESEVHVDVISAYGHYGDK